LATARLNTGRIVVERAEPVDVFGGVPQKARRSIPIGWRPFLFRAIARAK
jgi:hypothetical protein